MSVPLIDLGAQYRTIQQEIDQAVAQVLQQGQFVLGPQVSAFEQEAAAYLGTDYAVGVASGTDALVLALRALGIGPGDEVIVPAYTFFATAEAVLLIGALPVYVDIDADTYCLDVRHVAQRITARTRAIIPVHLYGHPADMTPLLELARAHKLKVIEDNAQAFGAEYNGRKTGGLGDVGCLSFFPSKNLGAYGDAGMLVTNDPDVAERVRMLRTHGWRKKYYPELVGYNSRLDELQAAVLRVKLRHLDTWNYQRRAVARRYAAKLAWLDVGLPAVAPYARHVFHLYMLRLKNRDAVQQSLKEQGIATAIYYPQPLHLTGPCRSPEYPPGSLPVAEQASRETLAIPLYPEMSPQQVQQVVAGLKHALVGLDSLVDQPVISV